VWSPALRAQDGGTARAPVPLGFLLYLYSTECTFNMIHPSTAKLERRSSSSTLLALVWRNRWCDAPLGERSIGPLQLRTRGRVALRVHAFYCMAMRTD
jgi:hypothetical protein